MNTLSVSICFHLTNSNQKQNKNEVRKGLGNFTETRVQRLSSHSTEVIEVWITWTYEKKYPFDTCSPCTKPLQTGSVVQVYSFVLRYLHLTGREPGCRPTPGRSRLRSATSESDLTSLNPEREVGSGWCVELNWVLFWKVTRCLYLV